MGCILQTKIEIFTQCVFLSYFFFAFLAQPKKCKSLSAARVRFFSHCANVQRLQKKKQFGRQVMQFIGQIQKCNKISDENKQRRKRLIIIYLLLYLLLWCRQPYESVVSSVLRETFFLMRPSAP